jgi:type IV pilus assembly protein PilV
MIIHKRNLQPLSSRTRGFTLVEVLVSLVVLAIGLLGIAKLMLFSSHSNDSAYLRSQATALAYEILDNMRANKTGALAGNYDTAAATGPAAPGTLCEAVNACATAQQVALYDVYKWKLRLNANNALPVPPGALPNGQGSVATALVATQTTVTIVVSWDDTVAQSTINQVAGATTQNVTLETLL